MFHREVKLVFTFLWILLSICKKILDFFVNIGHFAPIRYFRNE